MLQKAPLLYPSRPVDGGIVVQLATLHQPGPGSLFLVESLLDGVIARFPRPGLGQGEHFVCAAPRPLCLVLQHVAVSYHAIDSPPRRVGMSPELRLHQVAVGDVAIHPYVGQRPFDALLKAALVLAWIVLAPMSCACLLAFPVGTRTGGDRCRTAAVVSGQDVESVKHL